jgi:hypothetical protein
VAVSAAASVAVFTLVALVTVERWGATGATSAALTGVAAGAVVSVAMLRRDISMRVASISFVAAASVVVVASVA